MTGNYLPEAAHWKFAPFTVGKDKIGSWVPVWNGTKVAVMDLNGKNLRVAGGGACKV